VTVGEAGVAGDEAQEAGTVEPGQVVVGEDGHRLTAGAQDGERDQAVGCLLDPLAFILQGEADSLADGFVVVHDEHEGLGVGWHGYGPL